MSIKWTAITEAVPQLELGRSGSRRTSEPLLMFWSGGIHFGHAYQEVDPGSGNPRGGIKWLKRGANKDESIQGAPTHWSLANEP